MRKRKKNNNVQCRKNLLRRRPLALQDRAFEIGEMLTWWPSVVSMWMMVEFWRDDWSCVKERFSARIVRKIVVSRRDADSACHTPRVSLTKWNAPFA